MIVYKWNINSISKKTINGIDDVVFKVVFEKFGIDSDGFSGKFKTSIELNTENVSLENFILYENLTQEIIINWIKFMTDEDIINQYIENEIKRSKNKEVQIEDGYFPWQIKKME